MPDVREPAIRVTMLPRDTNAHGTIFGGILLAYLDQAGAIATRATCHRVVTVKMTEVVFHAPVFVGDVVSFYARVTRIGTTSITVHVDVDRHSGRQHLRTAVAPSLAVRRPPQLLGAGAPFLTLAPGRPRRPGVFS